MVHAKLKEKIESARPLLSFDRSGGRLKLNARVVSCRDGVCAIVVNTSGDWRLARFPRAKVHSIEASRTADASALWQETTA
jgi:hypothetical protein